MQKQTRLLKAITGEAPDRLPLILWRHWGGDDQRSTDFARALVDFQRQWDFDAAVVAPDVAYCLTDYGLSSQWQGAVEGTRHYARPLITKSVDWTSLRRLEPTRGSLGLQLDTLRYLSDTFRQEVPFLQVVYSPLVQAAALAGEENLLLHLRQAPDRLRTGLNILTDNVLRFLDSLRGLPLAGILYIIHHASYAKMNEQEYRDMGRAYDLRILHALPPEWWLNIVSLQGSALMFDMVTDYPVQVLNWQDRRNDPNLRQGKIAFHQGALWGGLDPQYALNLGTPSIIREQTIDALEQTNGRRFILGTGGAFPATTPQSNLRAARELVEQLGS